MCYCGGSRGLLELVIGRVSGFWGLFSFDKSSIHPSLEPTNNLEGNYTRTTLGNYVIIVSEEWFGRTFCYLFVFLGH